MGILDGWADESDLYRICNDCFRGEVFCSLLGNSKLKRIDSLTCVFLLELNLN